MEAMTARISESDAADSIVDLVQVLRVISEEMKGAVDDLKMIDTVDGNREQYYVRSQLASLVESIEGVDSTLMAVLRSVDRMRKNGGDDWERSIGFILARNILAKRVDTVVE